MKSIIERYRLQRPPAKLYKYRSIDPRGRTRHIFEKSELWFASPLSLNDPFECRFGIEFDGSTEARRRYFHKMIRQRDERISRKQRDVLIEKAMSGFYGPGLKQHTIIDEETFVRDTLSKQSMLCLTEKPDDILMWSHYADSHRGICLEFSVAGIPRIGILRRVNYANRFPVVNMLKMPADVGFEILLTKAPQWTYEAEWRSVVRTTAHQHAFEPEILSGVILGCQISSDDEKLVRNWLSKREPVPSLYRAERKRGEFGLRIVGEPLA